MRLRAKVINLVRLHFGQNACEVGGVRQIAVMQLEAGVIDMRILINMIHALGVQRRGTPLDAMHLVALLKQKFSKVGAVLAGHTGDEGTFAHGISSTNLRVNTELLGEGFG